jgi:hypothetical protein
LQALARLEVPSPSGVVGDGMYASTPRVALVRTHFPSGTDK